MLEPMTIRAGALVFAADETGIYLVNGEEGEWESDIIMADSDMHWEVEMLLAEHGVPVDRVIMLHSTSVTEPGAAWPSEPGPQWASWHPSGTSIVHTYVTVVRPAGFVLDEWPQARPVTVALADAVDRPPSYQPTDAPVPRHVDVMFHGLRHIRSLIDTDDDNADALGELWRRHIQPFRPVLARMYHRKRVAA